MAGRLDGKVALISGGASGIGAAHAREFLRLKGRRLLLVISRRIKAGRSPLASIRMEARRSLCVWMSRVENDWQNAVHEAVSRFGRLTTLINNAGVYWPSGVEEETRDKWQKMIEINQTGVWLGMKTAVPALRTSGNAAIVNISSLYGLIGSPGSIAYHASKGAVRLMTKAAALEYVRQGIRVNSHPSRPD